MLRRHPDPSKVITAEQKNGQARDVRRRAARGVLLAGLLCALACGCGVGSLALGQLELINGQRRLEHVIAASPDPQLRALLAEVPRIRAFGAEVLDLWPGKSYT